MARKRFSKADIRLFNKDAQGRAYLEYNDKVGGEPFGFSEGSPYVKDRVAMYRECISKGVRWEELLGVQGMRFDELGKE